MLSLGHILREASDEYLTYLSKKTGFLIRGDALTGAQALHDFLRLQLKSFDLFKRQVEETPQAYLYNCDTGCNTFYLAS